MEIKQEANNRIKAIGKDGGYVISQTAEANILYAILQKLEEIRCQNVDIENAIEKL